MPPLPFLVQLAFLVALGVLIDTLLVRTLLVRGRARPGQGILVVWHASMRD